MKERRESCSMRRKRSVMKVHSGGWKGRWGEGGGGFAHLLFQQPCGHRRPTDWRKAPTSNQLSQQHTCHWFWSSSWSLSCGVDFPAVKCGFSRYSRFLPAIARGSSNNNCYRCCCCSCSCSCRRRCCNNDEDDDNDDDDDIFDNIRIKTGTIGQLKKNKWIWHRLSWNWTTLNLIIVRWAELGHWEREAFVVKDAWPATWSADHTSLEISKKLSYGWQIF